MLFWIAVYIKFFLMLGGTTQHSSQIQSLHIYIYIYIYIHIYTCIILYYIYIHFIEIPDVFYQRDYKNKKNLQSKNQFISAWVRTVYHTKKLEKTL